MTDKDLLTAFTEEAHRRGWSIDVAVEKLGFARSTFFNWQKGSKISNRGRAAMAIFISSTDGNNYGNSINHSHIEGSVTQTANQSADAVEAFRAGLIGAIILIDGDAATKDAVLKLIATFGKKQQ